MAYSLATTVEPASEPVSLTEAKSHCRVTIDDDDDLITSLIKAARRLTEQHTRRRWINQTVRLQQSDWSIDRDGERSDDELVIPVEPVSSISSVQYYADGNGTLTTIANTSYQTWLDRSPPLVAPLPDAFWPTLQVGRLAPVQVTFVAGYGSSASSVPAEAKQAILLTVAYWYEHRGDSEDPSSLGLPAAALRLLRILDTGRYS